MLQLRLPQSDSSSGSLNECRQRRSAITGLSGSSITSSDAETLSELRAQDTVTQLERGEGLVNEKLGW